MVAEWNGDVFHIEVKGWPSTHYADPKRAHEKKPTTPTVQANHWFAGAVHSALKLRQTHPGDRVVIALPDKPRYRALLRERDLVLRRVGVEFWFVEEMGRVLTAD